MHVSLSLISFVFLKPILVPFVNIVFLYSLEVAVVVNTAILTLYFCSNISYTMISIFMVIFCGSAVKIKMNYSAKQSQLPHLCRLKNEVPWQILNHF